MFKSTEEKLPTDSAIRMMRNINRHPEDWHFSGPIRLLTSFPLWLEKRVNQKLDTLQEEVDELRSQL